MKNFRQHRRIILLIGLVAGVATGAMSQSDTVVKGFVVDQTGKLGVGTNAPTQTLHVAGNSLTEGVLMGEGVNGRFGSSAVISGFDVRYGQRAFVLTYNGTDENPSNIQINAVNPTDPTQSVFKTFIIDHPNDPGRHLVHAALEGPEGAVFYRGSAQLIEGRIKVELPKYFEALTRSEGRTIQLTNVDGFDRISVQTRNGTKILDGSFEVVAETADSRQRFDWVVTAVRADGALLEVEPDKGSIIVGGAGPYTYKVGPAELTMAKQ